MSRRVPCFQESLDKGLSAKDWIAQICNAVGGKGGGKDSNAQATLENASAIDEAVKVARKFAELKLSC